MIVALAFIFFTPLVNMLSRANRNNNPGNLRYAGQSGASGADPQGFAIFSTIEMGWNALYVQIQRDAQRGYDLQGFINKFAPSSENDTAAYLDFLSQKTGAGPGTPLASMDTILLAQSIARFEGYIG